MNQQRMAAATIVARIGPSWGPTIAPTARSLHLSVVGTSFQAGLGFVVLYPLACFC